MKDYLLFDLDGTLTDPKVGICTCVQYALHSFGIEEPDLDKLEPFIGPPLADSFMQFYGMSREDAETAVEKYRERFRDVGIFENKIYRGIPGMLRKLCAEGFHLAVASSKPTVYVERILEHFHIKQYFEVVVGSELDGSRSRKSEVVEEALCGLFAGGEITGEQKAQVYMIGDTRFDIEGARECGVESVGVSYGYGGLEELTGAHADYIVQSVEELRSFLLRTRKEEEKVSAPLWWLWSVSAPLLLFWGVRIGVLLGLALALFEVQHLLPQGMADWLMSLEMGDVGLTANGTLAVNLISFLCAGGVIARRAKEEIAEAGEDVRLLHLRGHSLNSWFQLAGLALGSVIGLNLLFSLTGLNKASDGYNAFVQANRQASFLPGLLCYGIVSPLAEELLFRGILYNRLRKLSRRYPAGCGEYGTDSPRFLLSRSAPAALLSALLFGLYHGNMVQGLYAFVIGLCLAYGYEYFGSFLVPLAIHVGANLLAWVTPSFELGGIPGWAICALCLLTAGVCARGLHGEKGRER